METDVKALGKKVEKAISDFLKKQVRNLNFGLSQENSWWENAGIFW